MQSFICVTCGVGYAPSKVPPERCAICDDERQYVTAAGQRWTTLAELQARHTIEFREQEPGLVGIGSAPSIAIGQRMLLIQQAGGGVLWDCTPLVTDEAVRRIKELGGVPIHIHAANRQYVMRPSERVRYWDGETLDLGQSVTLIRCGGHFVGSTALHWPGEDGKGVLMTGDTIMVVPDTRWVSFMYSYPNLIPLPEREVRRIVGCVEGFAYDRIYSAWWDRVMVSDAKARVQASAERYIAAIRG